MSRKRVGPFAVTRDMFANHSDLGVIVALACVGVLAALGYAVARGNNDGAATVKIDQSTTSTPRFTAPLITRPTVAPKLEIPATTISTATTPPAVESTTTTRQRNNRRNNPGAKTGGAKSRIKTAPGPATNVRWTASPGTVTLGPGAHISGRVVVKNLSPLPGWVLSPGCSPGPSPGPSSLSAVPFRLTCAPTGRQVVLSGLRSHRWEWSWYATVDGKIRSTPLAPGIYSFNIGPAIVTVTVI